MEVNVDGGGPIAPSAPPAKKRPRLLALLDVVMCTGGGPVTVTAASYEATVTNAIGHPGVTQGDRCSITVGPGDGPFPCRARITCGGRELYGAGGSGYAPCSADPSGALTIRDTQPTADGGDSTLDLRVASGEAILTDEIASGTWVVTMHFDAHR